MILGLSCVLILVFALKVLRVNANNHLSMELIYSSEFNKSLMPMYHSDGDYWYRVFNPFMWTFEQMFPGLKYFSRGEE